MEIASHFQLQFSFTLTLAGEPIKLNTLISLMSPLQKCGHL